MIEQQKERVERPLNKQEAEKSIEIGKTYRVARRDIGGYLYSVDYDKGNFILVRVLESPDETGRYKVTTRGEDGEHLGPGGGWSGESELRLMQHDLEEI